MSSGRDYPRTSVRCEAEWPYDEPRDRCSLNAWHPGPHKTYHEQGVYTGVEKHVWPNQSESPKKD